MFRSLVFILSIILASSEAHNPELGKIILANVLFRHGDRTPGLSYATDPWKDESHWSEPFGQLTNEGKDQIFKLGQFFRERYNDILPAKYSPHDIYVRSTDTDRTLMSAAVALAGMYPPVDAQIWNTKMWMPWIPIPVHTVPEDQDNVLAGKKPCPRYDQEFNHVVRTLSKDVIKEEQMRLFQYLSTVTGEKITEPSRLVYLYKDLLSECIHRKTLPEWTRGVFPDKMEPLVNLAYSIPAYNKILQKLRMGPLLKEMVSHMVQKSKRNLVPDRKLFMYSGHDETVASLLMALGVFEPPHLPPYASTVFVELRLNSANQHVVTISYMNSGRGPTLMTLRGCTTACPLSQFIDLVTPLIPEDWDKECSLVHC